MIRKLLVALDGSGRTAGVLAAALEIAARFDATLIPFRASQAPPEFPPAAHVSQPDLLAGHLEQAAIEELLALLRGITVTSEPPVIGLGQPWRAILQAAEEHDVDLIVLGSHGYHGLDRALGTTAGKVANLARRNVLVVHNPHSHRTQSPNPSGKLGGAEVGPRTK